MSIRVSSLAKRNNTELSHALFAAIWRGVLPKRSSAFTSISLDARRDRIIDSLSNPAAMCNGVSPFRSFAFGSSPSISNLLTLGWFPMLTAL